MVQAVSSARKLPRSRVYDLGSGYSYTKFGWAPDRKLNPHLKDIPDVKWMGIILTCPHGNTGAINFDRGEQYKELFGSRANWWTLESEVPLTLSPSIQTVSPNCCHGYIKQGKWVNA